MPSAELFSAAPPPPTAADGDNFLDFSHNIFCVNFFTVKYNNDDRALHDL